MFNRDSFQRTYETDVREVKVRGRVFRLFTPRRIEPFMGQGDALSDFPLWAKIWEASLVLADFLAGMPPEPDRRFLEIGAGIGLVSLVAASFGHDITLTEHNPHALEFARANADANGCPGLPILDLDWNRPSLQGRFDGLVGSEVVYRERDFEPLVRLFDALLKPGGEIILAEGVRKTSVDFFARMQGAFEVKGHRKVLRSGDKEVPVILCRMRR
jgi:predicted nicotinamide N-methyase